VEARELTWQTLTPPEYIDVSRAEVEKFLATGRVGPYEKEYFRKDGTRKWLLFAGSSLGNNQCVEFCVDISDQKKAEEALLRSEKLAAVGRMAATIAHEINNPLEAVMSVLFLAKENKELPESTRQYLETADAELNRVAHITRQSLEAVS
jgi:signal transduction histidine kinase